MFRYPFPTRLRAAFGDRGYGLPVSGLPDTLATLDAPAVRTAAPAVLQARRPVVVAVGDTDPDRAMETLAGIFGDSRPGRRRPPARPTGGRWQRFRRSGGAAGRHQSAMAMVFPGVSRADPARYAAMVSPRWRAGWAAGCSRACAAGARWRIRWWPPPGAGPGRALVTYIATTPSGRKRRGRPCWKSWLSSPGSRFGGGTFRGGGLSRGAVGGPAPERRRDCRGDPRGLADWRGSGGPDRRPGITARSRRNVLAVAQRMVCGRSGAPKESCGGSRRRSRISPEAVRPPRRRRAAG